MSGSDNKSHFALRAIVALVSCQIGLHACMAGMRIAIPLKALNAQFGMLSIGWLVACFSIVPALLALQFGKFTDRYGFHRPMLLAASLSILGALVLITSESMVALMVGASCCGAASGFGMIAVQRTGSRLADNPAMRLKIFSSIALAPATGGLIGSVAAGLWIDAYGFQIAFALLALLPVFTLLSITQVPRDVASVSSPLVSQKRTALGSFSMLKDPSLRHILLINLCVIASWDVHNFALPILGHSHHFTASQIGAIFAAYSAATIIVRVVLPFVADYIAQRGLIVLALMATAGVFALYPLMSDVYMFMLGAALIGCALGMVQPTIMTLLHDVSPQGRQGEVFALRSMMTQASLTFLPLCYGVLGAYAGTTIMFWLMAIALSWGAWLALRFSQPKRVTDSPRKESFSENSNV